MEISVFSSKNLTNIRAGIGARLRAVSHVENVWPEKWVLPFKIHPLGSPEHQLNSDEAKKVLPVFERSGET